jgi:hypothetical protein
MLKPAGIPCTCALEADCLHRPPGAGRGRATAASARGGICACCPPALDLACSQATNSPSAEDPRLSVGTLTGSAKCIYPSGGSASPFEGLRATAGPSTPVAAATFAQDDRSLIVDQGDRPFLIAQDDRLFLDRSG